ncbi:MAG: sulfotransferase [Bacteroidales bacterium]|nr:sulfotransferase [Bacteroidales bacterium]
MKKIFIPIISFFGKQIEKHHFTEPPVYIGGCGRSGTTLLLSVLSAHKNIFACQRELNPFANASLHNDVVKAPKFYRLYRTFITTKIGDAANRYCEKSPANIRHIDLIDRFHQGRFRLIHLVRDGRDVILSRHPRGKSAYWVTPERWINDVSAGLKYKEHPCVLTIRYEDLVTNFEATVAEICRFLEIPLSDEILHWHTHATVRKNNALFNPIGKINHSPVGKWKQPEHNLRVSQLTNMPEASALLKTLRYQ